VIAPEEVIRSALAERASRLADEAPTADEAARVLLAQVCAEAGWDAARLELRNEFERRPVWHVRRRRRLPSLRAAAEERRHAATFLDEGLRGESPWLRRQRQAGLSFLFPLTAGSRLVGALETFAQVEPAEGLLELTRALCEACSPVLARKPAAASLSWGVADPLTGLAARPLFMQRLATAVERARRSPGTAVALIVLALDRFKLVNDGLGHQAGDELLRGIGRRIAEQLRPGTLAARLDGDEFGVLLERVHDPGLVLRLSERLQRALDQPFRVAGEEVYASASLGVAFGGQDLGRAEDLLRDADIAAQRAKGEGVGRRALFESSMRTRLVAQLALDSDLRRAVEGGQIEVHYQPVVSLVSGAIGGFEALARWRHPELGFIPPARFIPAAEQAGLIGKLGNHVLREACAGMRLLQMSAREPLSMSVNLSAAQVFDPALVGDVAGVLDASGIDPSRMRLEVTESMLVDRIEAAAVVLQRLRGLNVRICIDDFGTGYSSLSYLHLLPVDILKVDRSFVAALGQGGKAEGIIAAVAALASNLGLELIAEGVETEEQAAALRRLGVTQAQGWHFAKAMDLQHCAARMAAMSPARRSV